MTAEALKQMSAGSSADDIKVKQGFIRSLEKASEAVKVELSGKIN